MILLTERQVVWMPLFIRNSLAIVLDRKFAIACSTHVVKDMQLFTEGVWKYMDKQLPVHPSNFLDIKAGILPKGFYAGRDGLWLTLDTMSAASSTRPLVYYGHNEDIHDLDRLWLLQAFGAWAQTATTVLVWE